jgi:hypothetical protein
MDLPNEILSTILLYANSSRNVRQVSHALNDIDKIADKARESILNKNFPDWEENPQIIYSNPDIDPNTVWYVFRHTGANYKLLADKTPNPEILLQIIDSGYNDMEVIVYNSRRLGLMENAIMGAI